MSDTTPEGVSVEPITTELSQESAVETLLERWGVDEETPSTDAKEATPEETPQEPDAELDLTEETVPEDPVEAPVETEPATKRVASDDDEVVIKVDTEERRVSVKDLSRLYGQEASLTRKSQELSGARKLAEDQSHLALAVLTRMYEKATERAKPYENIDLFKASRELEPSEFDALRAEMAKATEEKRFFEAELGQLTQTLRTTRDNFIRSQASTAIATLKEKIPQWSDGLYDELRTYAVKEGMHPDVVNQIVDPNALLMIHKARLYDAAKAKAKAKVSPTTTKVPSKATRPASAPVQGTRKEQPAKAMDRFKQTGDRDDAVNALLAKWMAED